MILPQHLQCLTIEWLGLGIVALEFVQAGQVEQTGGIAGVLLPQRLFVDIRSLAIEWLGLG